MKWKKFLYRITFPDILLIFFLLFSVNTFAENFSSWPYREGLIVGHTSYPLVNILVEFGGIDTASLISQGKMREDCGDIRVSDKDGNLYDFVVFNCNSSNTILYVHIPLVEPYKSKQLHMYYGNFNASSVSNFNAFSQASGSLINSVSSGSYKSLEEACECIIRCEPLDCGKGFLSSFSEGWYSSTIINYDSISDVLPYGGNQDLYPARVANWLFDRILYKKIFVLGPGLHSFDIFGDQPYGYLGRVRVYDLKNNYAIFDQEVEVNYNWPSCSYFINDGEFPSFYSRNYEFYNPETTAVLFQIEQYPFPMGGSFAGIRYNGEYNSQVFTTFPYFGIFGRNLPVINSIDYYPETIRPGIPIDFNVNATVESGTIRYEWSASEGNIQNPNSSSTKIIFSHTGTKLVRIKVWREEDGEEFGVYGTVTVDVEGGYAFPSFSIKSSSSLSGAAPHTVVLSADDENLFKIIKEFNPEFQYEWDFGDGSPKVVGKRVVGHTYKVSGTYTVTLRVTDRYGNQSVHDVEVVVSQPEDLTVRHFKVYYSNPYMRVPLKVVIRPVLEYMPGLEKVVSNQWMVGDSLVAQNRSQVVLDFKNSGDYGINFSGLTNYGRSLLGQFNLRVNPNQLPSCAMSYEDYPSQGYTKFIPSCSDPDGKVVSYFWEFGNGEVSKSRVGYAHYSQPGNYNVKLTVKDNSGESRTFSWGVSVTR